MWVCIRKLQSADLCDNLECRSFSMTTVVPVIIMFVVNYAVLHHKLKLSPLKFLRRDLSSRKQRRAVYLSPRMKIFHRFRLRVIFQNISNYLVLFVGIIFANLLLMFGLLLPSALDHYQLEIQNNIAGKISVYAFMLRADGAVISLKVCWICCCLSGKPGRQEVLVIS